MPIVGYRTYIMMNSWRIWKDCLKGGLFSAGDAIEGK